MINISLLIPIAIISIIIIAIIIVLVANSRKNSEPEASILDVNEVGVPSTSETNDFSYGYEKEETVVMAPVKDTEEDQKEEEKTEEE